MYSKVQKSNCRIRVFAFNQAMDIHDKVIIKDQMKITHVEGRLRSYYETQEGRDKELAADFKRVLDACDAKLAAAQEKTKHVEEALQAKTLELQELHGLLPKSDKSQQEGTRGVHKLETDVKNLKGRMQILQDKLMLEKLTNRALDAKIKRLQCRLDGKEEPKMTPEMKLYELMEDVKHVAEIYGEDSKECKIKQKQLDKRLHTMVDDANREAEAENAKHNAKRRAEFVKNAKRKEKVLP